MVKTRLQQLQSTLSSHSAYLLSNPADLTYFASFGSLLSEEREGFLVVTSEKSYLIQASFSPTPQRSDLTIFKGCSPQHLANYLPRIVTEHELKEIALDEEHLSLKEYKALSSINLAFTELNTAAIWQQRMVKDAEEQASVRQAAHIIHHVVSNLLENLEPGVTEMQLRHQLVQQLLQHGAEAEAFPTIIAFGDHTALPHHQPTERQLHHNMPVLIDAGAKVADYRSDITRTVWFGSEPSAQFQTIEQVVHSAYAAAYKLLDSTPYPTAGELDQTARAIITEAGYGSQFNHTTGHGVGLDIHEPPSLNGNNHTPLLPGMIITIEPGIYLEGNLGYRFENSVLLSPSGAEVLTR